MTAPAPTLLVLGAASDIGRAIAQEYAKNGYNIILAARGVTRLKEDGDDLRVRYGRQVELMEWDVLSPGGGYDVFQSFPVLPDVVICVVGMLGDQSSQERASAVAEIVMRTNYTGPALVLGEFANRMQERGAGTIIGISSVAGDRGRATNYIYGSAKAGFTAFLSGLRNRLAKQGVHVVTIKPGFVDTRMTAGMKLPKALTAEPAEVARAAWSAAARGKDIIYVRPVWRVIMIIICAIPEGIFKKLKL